MKSNEITTLRCNTCNAQFSTIDTNATTIKCEYCGSVMVLDRYKNQRSESHETRQSNSNDQNQTNQRDDYAHERANRNQKANELTIQAAELRRKSTNYTIAAWLSLFVCISTVFLIIPGIFVVPSLFKSASKRREQAMALEIQANSMRY